MRARGGRTETEDAARVVVLDVEDFCVVVLIVVVVLEVLVVGGGTEVARLSSASCSSFFRKAITSMSSPLRNGSTSASIWSFFISELLFPSSSEAIDCVLGF